MKLCRIAALLLALVLAACAGAEGILPVLQTPPPEMTETISYHRVMNFSSTPSASHAGDDSFYYVYSSVRYADYLAFGRALAQEGYALSESGFTESGLARLVVKNGPALTLDYNPFCQELTVRYPPRVLAWEADSEHPYEIDGAVDPILPELPQALSYHRAMNLSYPPSGESFGDGRWRYDYTGVDYAHYRKFGCALAQEGFTLIDSSGTEDGATEAVVSNGAAKLTLLYNPFTHVLRVIYPLGTLAEEEDPDDRYAVDPTQDPLLPELEQTISLHAVTGKAFTNPDRTADGYRYPYYDVPYAAYAQFSVKLGEAGFSLVSSERTEDGLDRAVVSDGKVTLTLDYDQENNRAYVAYPLDVSPRDASQYDDYTIVGAGDSIELDENLTATVIGWEKVDLYVTYYYDNNWIPFAKYFDNEYPSGNGVQRMLVTFEIENNRPEALTTRYLLNNLGVFCDGESMRCDYGELTSEAKLSTDSDDRLSPKGKLRFAVGFALTEAQAAHPENVAVTFTDKRYALRYAYIPEP
ncbi:MAG: hypothetical protein IJH38_01315 [Clostridia bacterium]|nr:hypothetical protein [Clostridia bacterium]